MVRIPARLVLAIDGGRAHADGGRAHADEDRTFAQIHAVLAADGLQPAPSHVEVYLSDPRRTRPDRLETVLLRELA